ncbi:MAG: THUMP domain-containing protein, partial [Nitrospiraceae bacterium]|nr:THUMP domain-containing protein [Nitrospiraceae bacterium]
MKREKRSRIMVSCGRGAFSVLSEEIRMLGLPVRAEFAAGVMTEGAFEDALSLNLRLHTGQRVYFLINEFTARDPQAVYRGVSAVPWEDYLHEDGYFSVTSHTDSPSVKNSRYMNLKAKDAVADRMRQVRGRR